MIAVVDYGVGNLRSAAKGLERAASEEGVDTAVLVTSNPEDLEKAAAVVLPGVGAFGACMQSLETSGLRPTVQAAAASGKPFLGICVGMQILFQESDEFGPVAGLGILPGRVERLSAVDVPIPHMGWNAIECHGESPLLGRTEDGTYFYFVHSYYVVPEDKTTVATTTNYGIDFVSGIHHENIHAFQFHPEKSQQLGLALLRNFSKLAS